MNCLFFLYNDIIKIEIIKGSEKMKKEKLNSFSVPLGLLDYGNPILYSITIITILKNIYSIIGTPYNTIMLVGAIISIFFGFIIPTGKVIIGLGIMKFRMPVPLVFIVNLGILISGLIMIKYVMNLNSIIILMILTMIILTLYFIYRKNKKMNTIAVLIGAFGYMMLYISLITLSFHLHSIIPIILYGIAILLFIFLCGVGIKANLKKPRVHWLIEISNVICQLLVAVATIYIYHQ